MSLPNPSMNFTPFDPLPASDLNDLVENIEALADGTGLNDDAVTAPKLVGIDKSNLTTDSNPYKFLVYRNSARNSGAGTFVAIEHDTKIFDTSNSVDVVTNKGRFTAPVSGFYQFNAVAALNAGSGDSLVCLYKNGTRYIDGNRFLSSGPINQYQLSTIIQLVATDYIETYVYSGASVSMTVGSSPSISTQFSGFLVSRT